MGAISIDFMNDPNRSDSELNRWVKELARGDNRTNFLHLAKVYAIIGGSLAAAVWIGSATWSRPFSWTWMGPLYLAAVLAIGASRHQLAGPGHEGSHHILFRHRLLNELASDLLCMNSLVTTTFQFRLYHLQHHQFVNDPERDPDFAMLRSSGHWLDFPVTREEFAAMLRRQAFVWPLLRHLFARARYNAFGTPERSPYRAEPGPWAGYAKWAGLAFLLSLAGFVGATVATRSPGLAVGGGFGSRAVAAAVFLLLPADCFATSKLKPVIAPRPHAILRAGYFAVLFAGLGSVQAAAGFPAILAYAFLWLVPLGTTFPLFLVLRQTVQHGNADRGFLTNTRVFHVNPLLRCAIFPFGMDYHPPHHMYATVPHFRLRELHGLLRGRSDYAAACVETEGYLRPSGTSPRRPGVVEVLGPAYAATGQVEVFVDEDLPDGVDPDNLGLLREAGREAHEGAASASPNPPSA